MKEFIHSAVIGLYLRRIYNASLARDRCKENSWGYNYWSQVVYSLQKTLDRYLVKEGIFE